MIVLFEVESLFVGRPAVASDEDIVLTRLGAALELVVEVEEQVGGDVEGDGLGLSC